MSPTLIKWLALLALAAGLAGIGWMKGAAHADAAWQARWTARDAAEAEAAAGALARQVADRNAADARNKEIEDARAKSDADLAAARADADWARRLLAAATRPAAAGGAVPEAGHLAGAAPAGPAGGAAGAGRLSELLEAYRAECRANADTLDELNAELTPQL